MATALTHGFAAVALGKMASQKERGWRFWVLAAGSAVIPDGDVIGFAFGVQYDDFLGHRGFFHSLLFALLWASFVVLLEFRQTRGRELAWLIGFFFVVTASHGVLDAMTDGGLGVAFFSPFDTTRYFFGWRPLEVSPISIAHFFDRGGGAVLASEFRYVWLPLSSLWFCVWTARRFIEARRDWRRCGNTGGG